MTDEQMWNDDEPIADRFEGIEVPRWIEKDISPYDVAAIVQGGCASGAYMPAVTYHAAVATMSEHGDDVFDYLSEVEGSIPQPGDDVAQSWGGLACFFLSCAVELWASMTHATLYESEDA